MKTLLALAAVTMVTVLVSDSPAQEPKTATPAAKPTAVPQAKLTSQELEAKFIATMTKATMTGRWCLIKDGQLTPERDEKYTILGVKKLGGDAWAISSRIQYNKQDIIVPIPVKVQWAGDTPVIIVDKLTMPGGGGTYSARVLVYEHTYAGTWSGGDKVGLLNGTITNERKESTAP